MITINHDYKIPSDNLAQYSADEIDRQEVTHEFMMDHVNGGYGLFVCCYFWRGDDDAEMGLDPWQIVDDFEYFAKDDTRVFVERKHLIEVLLDIRNVADDYIERCKKEGTDNKENTKYVGALERFMKLTETRDEMLRLVAINATGHIAGLHPTIAKALRDSDISWEEATRNFRARMKAGKS